MKFDLSLLKIAPYLERLCNVELWLQGDDGHYYRPTGGWPIA